MPAINPSGNALTFRHVLHQTIIGLSASCPLSDNEMMFYELNFHHILEKKKQNEYLVFTQKKLIVYTPHILNLSSHGKEEMSATKDSHEDPVLDRG